MINMQINLGRPQPKQAEFLKATNRYVAYGGARGGGKSWAIRYKCVVLALKYPGIRQLIIRRTYPELWSNHIQPLKQQLDGIGKYHDGRKEITLINGSVIIFGFCANLADVDRYQGQEYDVIYMDEATQFMQEIFDSLRVCVRGVNNFPDRKSVV